MFSCWETFLTQLADREEVACVHVPLLFSVEGLRASDRLGVSNVLEGGVRELWPFTRNLHSGL